MTVAGWITMLLCWTTVTGLCLIFVIKTLTTKTEDADKDSE